jgi:hypothetical protein
MDPANPPKVTDQFLGELKGREFFADITKTAITMKNAEGKYVPTGNFKNELKNFKTVEA